LRDAISETPSTRGRILGSDHCGRTNTNANTNGKWRVTRHRHLRLINATSAATIRRGGAHENAAERSLCPDSERADPCLNGTVKQRWWCPNQSRVFNYARHRPVLRLRIDSPNEKETMSGKPIPFFRVSIDRADSEASVIGLRKRIILRVKWFNSGRFEVTTSMRNQKPKSWFTRFYVIFPCSQLN